MVEMAGFQPATFRLQGEHSGKLSYIPIILAGGVRLLAPQTFGGKTALPARRGLVSRATYLMAAGLSAREASSIAARSQPGLGVSLSGDRIERPGSCDSRI